MFMTAFYLENINWIFR